MTTLLDANVLIALLVVDHVHHDSAERWFHRFDDNFATCPSTEGSLIRLLLRQGQSATEAKAIVSAVSCDSRHEFWSDPFSYAEVSLAGVIGHRQVADAYLAQLARARGGRLASFDKGLATLHHDVVDLLPVSV